MIPYTYLLKHKPTNTYYYGVRYARACAPSDLWIKYFTSSKHIKNLICQYGKDSFIFEIRKTFLSKDKAILWEHKVLKRMNVISRVDFLNKTDNISISPEAALKAITNRPASKKQIEKCRKMGLLNKGRRHSGEINKSKGTPNNKFKLGVKESFETRRKKSLSKLGKPSNALGNSQPRCSCVICHKETTSSSLKRHINYNHS